MNHIVDKCPNCGEPLEREVGIYDIVLYHHADFSLYCHNHYDIGACKGPFTYTADQLKYAQSMISPDVLELERLFLL